MLIDTEFFNNAATTAGVVQQLMAQEDEREWVTDNNLERDRHKQLEFICMERMSEVPRISDNVSNQIVSHEHNHHFYN